MQVLLFGRTCSRGIKLALIVPIHLGVFLIRDLFPFFRHLLFSFQPLVTGEEASFLSTFVMGLKYFFPLTVKRGRGLFGGTKIPTHKQRSPPPPPFLKNKQEDLNRMTKGIFGGNGAQFSRQISNLGVGQLLEEEIVTCSEVRTCRRGGRAGVAGETSKGSG